MAHVLTLKITPSLLHRLEKRCSQEGRSKGAVVREAIESLLETEATATESPSVEEITQSIIRGKVTPVKIDWTELRRKAREGAPKGISPEQEVRLYRGRGIVS